jgi:hypothetical protein
MTLLEMRICRPVFRRAVHYNDGHGRQPDMVFGRIGGVWAVLRRLRFQLLGWAEKPLGMSVVIALLDAVYAFGGASIVASLYATFARDCRSGPLK